MRQEQSIRGAEKARKSTCLGGGIPLRGVLVMRKTPEVSAQKTLPLESASANGKMVYIRQDKQEIVKEIVHFFLYYCYATIRIVKRRRYL